MLRVILGSRIGRAIAAAGALLLAVMTFGATQRRKGATKARREAKEADHENADQIRKRADDALERLDDDSGDVDERLRGLDAFRD